jgi:hypothetical protein
MDTMQGNTWLLMLRRNLSGNITNNAKNYNRFGVILDANVTAMDLFHDRWRGIQELYIAVNKTNLTYTTIHHVAIMPDGNFTVRNPPLRVQDTCVTFLKPTLYFLIYSCPTFNGEKEALN